MSESSNADLRGEELLARGLGGSVVIRENAGLLFELLEHRLSTLAEQSSAERGSFHVALSGGGTPKPFYESWAKSPYFPWDATHVWLVDERRVPYDDERSNWRMICEALCDRAPIPKDQLHPMPVEGEGLGARYSKEIASAFAGEPGEAPRFDFVLLGMGADGHTASLFPESPALEVADAWAADNDGERVVPPPRITLTYPVLNAARELVILAMGESKTATLEKIARAHLAGDADQRELPICGVDPTAQGGRLSWFLDFGAARVAD